MQTFIAYLKLFRLPLVFTAIADSAAGYLAGRSPYSPTPLVLVVLAVSSAGLYAFGMGMNDVADRDRDKALYPGRPLPSGRVSLKGALRACWALLALSGAAILFIPERLPSLAGVDPESLGWTAGLLRLVCWAGAVTAILAYDFRVKIPPVMGAVRALNFLMGYFVFSLAPWGGSIDGVWRPGVLLAAAPFLYGTSLTFVSTLEDGGVVHQNRLWFGACGMIAAALLPVVLQGFSAFALVPAGALAAWILFRARQAVNKKGVMLMVRDGVAGFILLDASIVMATGQVVEGVMLAALLVPAFGLMQIFKRLP